MSLNIPIIGRNGAGINLGFGDWNHDGKLDFRFGVAQFNGYGNGLYGGYNMNELGWGTGGLGSYAQNSGANWNPFSANSYSYGANAYSSWGQQSYGDIFGNYAGNNYAANVFGNYQMGSVMGNPWGSIGQQTFGSPWGAQTYNSFGGPRLGGWFGMPSMIPGPCF